jgi:hypothetical protein
MGLLAKLWSGLKAPVGLLLPVFTKAGDWRRYSAQVRWVLRLVLLAAILIALAFINRYAELGPFLPDFVQPYPLFREWLWLPLLGLMLYVLCWLGWWLWQLLTLQETNQFPDIDAAWEEAVAALNRTGIDLTEVPLFLVFGRSEATEEALFEAANLKLKVRQTPARAGAPLHVYADHDGIYVTCPGASLLGRQAAILAGAVPVSVESPDFDPSKTVGPAGFAADVQEVLRRAREQGRDAQHLSEDEQQEVQALLAKEKEEEARRIGKARSILLGDEDARSLLTARLRYLCRLIVRERRPFCPANGLLLVIPVAATDSDEDANHTGLLCRHDLNAAREVFQTHYPLFALVGDLEKLPGNCFREFVDRFPESKRVGRLGQRFPLVPVLDYAVLEGKIAESVNWICEVLIPSWVYRLCRVERAATDSLPQVTRGNARVIQFMSQMHGRRHRLARILTRGLLVGERGPLLFGGCYLGGTGEGVQEQAFVPGVLKRLLDDQSAVSWTQEAVTEEASFQRWTRYGYVGLAVAVAALAALAALGILH